MDTSRYQNKAYLRDSQYKSSDNLSARAQLHHRFSTAAQEWMPWVFDQLRLQPGDLVLECGCGPGWLWRDNLDRIPPNCHITLTDLSQGMVAEAKAALHETDHDFRFREVDAQQLPFATASFDVVVANHMLYHVPNIDQALSEIQRVLKPDGRLHAVTNGAAHMRELKELRRQIATQLGLTQDMGDLFTLPFRLENGAELLQPWFARVSMIPFPDSLRVTEVEPLLAYVFSAEEARAALTDAHLAQIREIVAQAIADGGGAMHITKAVGMFVAEKEK
ncbi:MAG: class I SAM-dependent methyltransferase [Anaerolinea sp.]|nr:class I SAM-dependent methyltransferase [Anaerolinea sp.]